METKTILELNGLADNMRIQSRSAVSGLTHGRRAAFQRRLCEIRLPSRDGLMLSGYTETMLDQFLTVAQASTHLQITTYTLYKWIQSNRIPAYRLKPNGALRIRASDIIEPYTGKMERFSSKGKQGYDAGLRHTIAAKKQAD